MEVASYPNGVKSNREEKASGVEAGSFEWDAYLPAQ